MREIKPFDVEDLKEIGKVEIFYIEDEEQEIGVCELFQNLEEGYIKNEDGDISILEVGDYAFIYEDYWFCGTLEQIREQLEDHSIKIILTEEATNE